MRETPKHCSRPSIDFMVFFLTPRNKNSLNGRDECRERISTKRAAEAQAQFNFLRKAMARGTRARWMAVPELWKSCSPSSSPHQPAWAARRRCRIKPHHAVRSLPSKSSFQAVNQETRRRIPKIEFDVAERIGLHFELRRPKTVEVVASVPGSRETRGR